MFTVDEQTKTSRQSRINTAEIERLKERLLINQFNFDMTANAFIDKRLCFVKISITKDKIIVEKNNPESTESFARRTVVVEKIIELYSHKADADFYEQAEKFTKTLK